MEIYIKMIQKITYARKKNYSKRQALNLNVGKLQSSDMQMYPKATFFLYLHSFLLRCCCLFDSVNGYDFLMPEKWHFLAEFVSRAQQQELQGITYKRGEEKNAACSYRQKKRARDNFAFVNMQKGISRMRTKKESKLP